MPFVEKTAGLALLEAFKQSLPAFDCLACALLHEPLCAPQWVVADEHGVVLLNRFAHRRGHLMVVPRRHIEHVNELSWHDYAALQRLAYDASDALWRVLRPVRVYNAVLGTAAPVAQSFTHMHIHLVPVYERDESARPSRVFSWTEGVFIYDDAEALELIREVRDAWRDTSNATAPNRAGK